MGSNRSRRARQLRKDRARLARTGTNPGTSTSASMKFRCQTCGTRIEQPGNVMFGDFELVDESTGEVSTIPMDATWEMKCPVCGRKARATNQVRVERDGHWVTGFADTPQHMQQIFEAINELKQLREDASLDEVLEVVERSPHLRPVASYLRRHHLELAGLGIGLATLVVALLTWLQPVDRDPAPSPPSGITRDQMERLLRELERETVDHEPERRQEDREHRKGHAPSAPGDDDAHQRGTGEDQGGVGEDR